MVFLKRSEREKQIKNSSLLFHGCNIIPVFFVCVCVCVFFSVGPSKETASESASKEIDGICAPMFASVRRNQFVSKIGTPKCEGG